MVRHMSGRMTTHVGLMVLAAMLSQVGQAEAQSTYVGASVMAEIARFGTAGGFDEASGGEAFGGAVRIGTAVTERWGLDLEFARPGEIEKQNSFDFPILLAADALLPSNVRAMMAQPPGRGGAGAIFPAPIPYSVTTSQRYATLTIMPYVRQPLGARADIVYLGGLALLRTTRDVRFGGGGRLLGVAGGRQTSVTYDSAPAVGLDIRVSMTEHLRLVPGLRVIAVDEFGMGGWLTRPSIGLQWTF